MTRMSLAVAVVGGLLLIFALACSDSGGSLGTLPAGLPTPSGGTVLSSQLVGGSGGSVSITDTASSFYQTQVTVPANAVSTPTVIAVADGSTATNRPQLSSNWTQVGKTLELGPSGSVFAQPVNVEMHYSDADLLAAGITDESKLQMVTSAGGGGELEYLPLVARDTIANRLVAQTTHFSFFMIVSAANHPAGVSVQTPSGVLSGDIAVNFTISDQDNDAITLRVEYSAQSATSSTTSISTWQNAGVTLPQTSMTPGAYTLTWHSGLDLVGVAATDVVLRLIPHDGKATGVAGYTAKMAIDNSGGSTGGTNNGWGQSVSAFHTTGAPVSAGNPAISGGQIRVRSTVTNNTGSAQTISYASGQQYDFSCADQGGTEVWRWSADKSFTLVALTRSVNPGESLVSDIIFTVADSVGTPLTAGTPYTITAMITGAASPDALGADATWTFTPAAPGSTSGALTATVTTEDGAGNPRNAFTPGDLVVFKLTVTNGTAQTQTVSYTGACFQRTYFSVQDASGATIWSLPVPMCAPPPGGGSTNAQPDSLAPGASLTFTSQWQSAATDAAGGYTGHFQLLGSTAPDATPTISPVAFTLGSGGSTGSATISGTLTLRDASGASVTTVAPSQSVTWELVLTNTALAPASLSFPSSQQYDFTVTNVVPNGSGMPNFLYWQWSNGRMFTQAFTTLTFAAGESKTVTAAWSVVDNNGTPLGAGNYSGGASVPHDGSSADTVATITPVLFAVSGGSSGSNSVTGTVLAKDSAGAAAANFAAGAPITIEYTVTNGTATTLSLSFSNGQQHDVEAIGAAGSRVWLWSQGQMFTPATSTVTIAPNSAQTFTATWNQQDQSGAQVGAGSYIVQAWILPQSGSTARLYQASTTISIGASTGQDTQAPVFAGVGAVSYYSGQLTVIANQLTWTAAGDNVTAAANMRYNVYRYDVDPAARYIRAPFMDYSVVYATVTGQTSFQDMNIVTGRNIRYYYAVRAVDQAGNEDANTVEKSVTVP